MQYEITLKVGSEQTGCDPEALSSLGKLARMIAGETPENPEGARLGETARKYARHGKNPLDIFDLRKIDLSNEYAEPETIGERTK